ncbi:hypothetical protein JTB14_025081 [Gonioctena quinquepunctata]|nr:hypothetical protein JTB14_025081 [Gonioctena quinquepunctata]
MSGGKYYLERHEIQRYTEERSAASKSVQIPEFLPFEKSDIKYGLIKGAELRLCCYICEHNVSLLTLDLLPLLNKQIYPDSEIAKGVVLKRNEATKLLVEVLAPYIKKEIVENLKKTIMSIIGCAREIL